MRLVLAVTAFLLVASVAGAQQQQPIGPIGPRLPPQTLPTPQGAAGEGLYVAGADRVAIGTGDTAVATLQIPRGAYQVVARLVLANDRDSNGAVACSLSSGGAEIDYESVSVSPRSRADVTLLGVAISQSALLGRVDLRCQATGETAATARWARIHALAVSRVTGEAPAGR
ncbi:MAG: hypothetical protein H7124_03745 [Phycisphaerales bacterium]|nr:hypothetical protein [Hyphomonadaceae bacterium]